MASCDWRRAAARGQGVRKTCPVTCRSEIDGVPFQRRELSSRRGRRVRRHTKGRRVHTETAATTRAGRLTHLQVFLMELAGLEPATSWVRFGRAPRSNNRDLQELWWPAAGVVPPRMPTNCRRLPRVCPRRRRFGGKHPHRGRGSPPAIPAGTSRTQRMRLPRRARAWPSGSCRFVFRGRPSSPASVGLAGVIPAAGSP
jgi:hypothetical protein